MPVPVPRVHGLGCKIAPLSLERDDFLLNIHQFFLNVGIIVIIVTLSASSQALLPRNISDVSIKLIEWRGSPVSPRQRGRGSEG